MDGYTCPKKFGGIHVTPIFDPYVERIVQETDTTKEEKEDLREELLIHLELSYAAKRKEGYSEEDAKRIVVEDFGISGVIGDQIQEAMFPYRKMMMLTLSITSILFSISVYLGHLFVYKDAYMIWLLLSIMISTSLLVLTIQPIEFLNRRSWRNSLLLLHLFVYLYGMLMATSLEGEIAIVLTIVSWFIILFSLALIYRTTIFDVQIDKYTKIFHALNLTVGVFIIALTLFFVWAALAFSVFEWNLMILLNFLPFTIWLIAYVAGGRFIARRKKMIAYSLSVIPVLNCVYFYFVLL